LSKLTQELDFIWISDDPGWRSQNLQDDSVKPLDIMNYSVHLSSGPSCLAHSDTDPFLRMTSAWLFSLQCTPICTLHGNIEDYEVVIFPGNAWIHVDIQEVYFHILLNGTRKYSAKSHQEAQPTSVDTVLCHETLLFYTCGLQYLRSIRAALQARKSGACAREFSPDSNQHV